MSRIVKDLSIFIRTNLWLVPVVALLLGAVFYYAAPPPPMKLVMSTGFPTGGYEVFGQKLQQELAKQGFELELVRSSGSQQNAERLLDPDSGIHISLLQSGQELVLDEQQRGKLFSLGAIYHEPLWLFTRSQVKLDTIADLQNYRVAIGSQGGGVGLIVLPLLAANGVDTDNLGDNWRLYSGPKAAEELLAGELDALFLMVPPENEFIRKFANNPDVRLYHFNRTKAYERHFPFIHELQISRGLLSLENDLPPRDINTLSSKALLVVNDEFHPALTPLFLAAAREAMLQGTLLDAAQTWPIADRSAFPMLDEAEYFYTKGLPLLQRYLPFRIASLADRYIILLFPLLVVLFPLFKVAGPVYRWRIRSRIYRWYKHLRSIDKQLMENNLPPAQIQEEIQRLLDIQQDLARVEVPLAFTHELYELHIHVRLVLQRLRQREQGTNSPHSIEPLI